MTTVTLPDGSKREYAHAVTVLDVAQDISPGLARNAIAGKVDGVLVDTSYPLSADAKVQIITQKDPEGLEITRHSTAHLLAQAVKELFPTAQVTIGPVIEDGFFYDFAYEQTFTLEDLARIETKMHEIAKRNLAVSRKVLDRKAAVEFFQQQGENYKAEIINDLPKDEVISLYQQGDFVDLCRGPHAPNTSFLKVFKLMKLAGAYWRGDAKNAMLQRIYGTAWTKKEDLDNYLNRLAEAEKRDHRKLAKTLDLFHTQEEAPGMIFWHPNGLIVYHVLENYIRQKLNHEGYQEIRTPQILDCSLWEKSGHLAKFREEMFLTESEKRHYAIKPMSCPAHVQVFNQGLRSYRDLPLRFAEFGNCHRNEPSGALHGLMRVRGFTQDDGHIFCTEEQIQAEASKFIDEALAVYADFSFTDVTMQLSTRPSNRVGSDAIWDQAETALQEALDKKGLKWELAAGDGAFYGPKIGFSMKDCLGRVWTCGTLQLDFSMPQLLGASYIAEDNSRRVPVMLHRAILGSLERFTGILIEHYAGHFPAWLAPTQAVVMNITENQAAYCQDLAEKLKNKGFRTKIDLRNEKIGFKIREHTLQRIPYLLVVGDRELANNTVAVRTQSGQDLGSMSLAEFSDLLNHDIAQYGRIKN